MGRGGWQAIVLWVAKSWTRLSEHSTPQQCLINKNWRYVHLGPFNHVSLMLRSQKMYNMITFVNAPKWQNETSGADEAIIALSLRIKLLGR